MFQKNRHKNIIAAALLALFVAYYANVSFFYHCHIINGVTIVHSHFYGKTHTDTGAHSTSELTLIAALSLFQTLAAALFCLGIILTVTPGFYFRCILSPKIPARFIHQISLRAPPAFS